MGLFSSLSLLIAHNAGTDVSAWTSTAVAAALLLPGIGHIGEPLASLSTAQQLRPHIVKRSIPFGPKRKRQMAAYSEHHYGKRTWRLAHPHVIVEHWAEAGTAASVY